MRQNGSARADIETRSLPTRRRARLTADERTMLRAILKLGDMRVDDVMIPRADIEAIDIDSSLAEVIAIFRESSHCACLHTARRRRPRSAWRTSAT